MNWVALIIGVTLFIFGLAIANVGITDVTHDTQGIIAFMVLLAGCICLSMIGIRCGKS